MQLSVNAPVFIPIFTPTNNAPADKVFGVNGDKFQSQVDGPVSGEIAVDDQQQDADFGGYKNRHLNSEVLAQTKI